MCHEVAKSNFDILNLLSQIFVSIITTAVVLIFGYQYKKKELKKIFEIDQIKKAERVAELFAISISIIPDPVKGLSQEQKLELNKLSFEMALWLSKDIYYEVSKILENKSDKKDIKEVLTLVRHEIKGKDDFDWQKIIHWK